MTLMLSNDDAAKVLTMTNTIAALEALYMDLGNGSAIYRGRTDLFAPTSADIGFDVPAAHQINRAFRDRGMNPARDQRGCSTPFGNPSNFVPAASCGEY